MGGLAAVLPGVRNGRAKLTPETAREIRESYAAGRGTYRDLGREYGVSRQAIMQCVRGRRWT